MKLRTDADRAHRIAGAVGILGAAGIAFDHFTMPAAPTGVALGAIGICLAMLLWIVLTRQRARSWRGNLAFLIVQVAILTYLWIDQQRIAESGVVWVPFRANQLGAFTVALLAPPRLWVGLVAILGFAGTAVVQFLLFEPAVRERLAYAIRGRPSRSARSRSRSSFTGCAAARSSTRPHARVPRRRRPNGRHARSSRFAISRARRCRPSSVPSS